MDISWIRPPDHANCRVCDECTGMIKVPEQLRIYIAGWFGAQDRLRKERDRIHALGVGEVVGTWLDEEEGPAPAAVIEPGDITPEQCREYAIRDLGEVRYADLLILDTQDVNPRGGREVEYGVALANGLGLWIVGPKRNVFHYLAHRVFENWDEAIVRLKERP